MLITTPLYHSNPLRNAITKAYRMDEAACIQHLLEHIHFNDAERSHIHTTASKIVQETREYRKKQSKLDTLLYQYDLSTNEGVALMCLAEALLRIPDKTTMDKFISDKISTGNWRDHISSDNTLFVNAATWSLLLSGKIYAPALNEEKNLWSSLSRVVSKIGTTMIRPIMLKMMQAIGNQFVLGETIESAIARAKPLEEMGYLFSYDMLGEAARTDADADHYFAAYEHAIRSIGKVAKQGRLEDNPGVSIKLSALHPRYDFAQYERLLTDIPPKLLALAKLAKQYNIALVVDAEEADRLDILLDILQTVFAHPELNDWEGLGLAIQAYQKRTFYLIDWLADLAKTHKKRLLVRLVKGAYWDAEIKYSQVMGFSNYPVFTRKHGTDVSYLACAKKLLAHPTLFYSQFGTHNAYSIAAILEMADENSSYEFQCLHGMGRQLYDQLITANQHPPVRIYAPVGTHRDLLGYLVRRLLENGANSSFVNLLADESLPIDKVITDPITRMQQLTRKSHPRIPLPKDIYGAWENSQGVDLSDAAVLLPLKTRFEKLNEQQESACSIVNGKHIQNGEGMKVYSPIDKNICLGVVHRTNDETIEEAIRVATAATNHWGNTPVDERAKIIERAADLLQQNLPELLVLLCKEGGRCVQDAIGEIREAIDYCRYYAHRARVDLQPMTMPGPTGESNVLSLHPRGVIGCISPWNFPLAIFLGQILASLAAGNTVIAKPAEQTPLIASKAIQILHEAGVPPQAVQLLIGPGKQVGARLVSDPRVCGIIFTGSTETARFINQSLSKKEGPINLFVAETGGQNAMIVDSSALLEQSIIDITQSAFNSAGQRCSALRVLFVQEDIADKLLTMLHGYMQTMIIGDPRYIATDVGPVIDQEALDKLQNHYARMQQEAKLIAEVPMPTGLNSTYFAPCAFEIESLSQLKEEIFGPFLHIIRYKAQDIENVLKSIIATGYGLTMGIASRIETVVTQITNRMPVGNMYVNRNMIGAQVGVQPFGGEGLSGTGPKAGGPHYLPRLCHERLVSNNITAVGGNARLVSLLEED